MATKPRYVTDLGDLVLIVPSRHNPRHWLVASFSARSGRFKGCTYCETVERAKQRRLEIIKHHRNLAAETAARVAVRKKKADLPGD